jgi:hypothetical protein
MARIGHGDIAGHASTKPAFAMTKKALQRSIWR